MELHPGQDKRHVRAQGLAELDPIRRALEENEDWYRDLVQHSHDLLCIHDLQGRLLSVNPAPARVLGYSVEELLQIPMRELIAPEFRTQFDAYLSQLERAGEASGFMAVVTRTGDRRIWQYHNTLRTEGVASPIVRGMAHDVTEQMRAEKALRTTNEQLLKTASERERMLRELSLFRAQLDQSNDAIEIIDPETLQFLDVNERACIRLGYSREELLSMTIFDIDPNIDEKFVARLRQQLEESGFASIETVQRRKDGTTLPVEVSIRSVRLDRVYNVAVSRDITARTQAEKALRQSEERFRVALKNSPIAVFNQDRDLRYTWIYNPHLPLPVSEQLGKTLGETFEPEEAARLTEVRRRVLETGVGVRDEVQATFGGRKHYFDTTIEPLLDPAGAVIGITCASMDVTEIREASEALREAKRKLTEEKLYLEQAIDTELGFGEIIGQSKALRAVMQQVGQVAPSDATVLLLGETGSGKELVARAIHRLSRRQDSSFIKMNCASIPSGLLESELFGYEKGAFTSAVNRKIGRLELADKGTLFLDEIGEIPLVLQPKLLRVLQDQEFERLGGTQTLKVNFRLIAATNRNLSESVKQKEFRSDLYYRLNVFPIRVPPLRERREDIPLLVEHFVRRFSSRMNRSITSIPKKTMAAMVGWDWPGNVRELENFIEHSVILTQGSVLAAPIQELKIIPEAGVPDTLRAREREHILRVLRESHGHLSGPKGAAARLGLPRSTLQSKLKQLGIEPQHYRD